MPAVSTDNVLSFMAQADVAVTIPSGGTFTVPATVPFTTMHHQIDVPAGTVLAIMRTGRTPTNGKHLLQCFSVDEIITVT